ncbi:MAG: tRNA (adenosine(37)-N6)-threonylcarbamoyltransferase complex dimerization subunit type 1 TsaB [Balneolales bacterium]
MSLNILAIETATAVCSVAIRIDNQKPRELRQIGTGIHSEMVFVFTEKLLNQSKAKLANLDGIVLSAGPGSYTGLRVGSSAVKGMLFGSNVSFYAAHTLSGIAWGANKAYPNIRNIHAVLDARRKHLYHQSFEFEQNLINAKEENSIKPLSEFSSMIKNGDLIAGTGIERLPAEITNNTPIIGEDCISALHLIDLFDLSVKPNGQILSHHIKKVALEEFEPYY